MPTSFADNAPPVEPTGWRLVVRTFRGWLMKAGAPAVHFSQAKEMLPTAVRLWRKFGHVDSLALESRDVAQNVAKGLLSMTGLAPLYRGWYRWRHPKSAYEDLDEETQRGIGLFMAALQEVELPEISQILLYGSRARGDHDAWSDTDIAVVLAGSDPVGETFSESQNRLTEIGSKIVWETNYVVEVTAFIVWQDELHNPEKQRNPPFYRNVLADGIEIQVD